MQVISQVMQVISQVMLVISQVISQIGTGDLPGDLPYLTHAR